MQTKTEAVVLRCFKYGDNKMIAELFTRECGRVPFIVSVPKSGRGKVRKQMFCPMALLDIECDIRPRQRLQKMQEARLLCPLPSIATDPHKLAITLFTAEFLYHALRGEQRDEHLFDYIADSIQWLDSRADRFANFHLVFLMRLSRFLGFYPNIDEHLADGACFDLRAACFCAAPPLHRDFLMPAEAARIRTVMRMNFATMHLFRMSRDERNRLLEVIVAYYRIHIPDFPELRSLEVLRELFTP